jgi:hypothetical protein
MDKSAISSTIGLARKNSSTIGLAKFSFRLCVDKDQKVQELRSLNSRTGMCLSQNQLTFACTVGRRLKARFLTVSASIRIPRLHEI